MTHHTDAERAAYERELIDNHHYVPSDFSFKDGFYGGDDDYIQFGWDLWQAARRAPVAPVPDVTDAMIEAAKEAYCPFGDMHLAIQAALAAAPQPPEAAPVQLPEPQAEIEVRSMKTYLDLSIHEWRDTLPDGAYNIYTEHQVRELLAAHGIGKDKA